MLQGRLVKTMFGVSKLCLTTALWKAIQWEGASGVVFWHLRYGYRIGSFVVEKDSMQSLQFSKYLVRRFTGMRLSV